MERKFGVFSSSVNPQELSTTVEGVIKLLATLLVGFGVITTLDSNQMVAEVGVIVPAGIAVYQAGQIIFGIVRKIIVKYSQ